MRFCEYCGEKINEGDVYCLKCGKKQVIVSDLKPKKTGTEGLATASLVLGIISFVLSFIVNIFIIPLALVGLILGIVGRVHGRKYSGIVLNAIAMIVAVIVFILWIVLFVYIADNYDENDKYGYTKEDYSEVVGTWNCNGVNSTLDNDYDLVVTLNDDKTFILGDYNNTENYFKGVYYFEDDDLNSFIKSNKSHAIGLNPLEKYEHGDLVNEWDDVDDAYKMIVTKTKDKSHTVLIDDDNDRIYYCNK